MLLSVLFGDRDALATLRQTAGNPAARVEDRHAALQMMMDVQAEGLLSQLRALIADRAMRGMALRGLAAFNDPGTPALILQHYPMLDDAAKADAVQTLASRPGYALALLDGMEKGTVARRDLSAFTARQLFGFNDKRLTEKLNTVWGSIRPAAKDKAALLARYKALVPPDALRKADLASGRKVFDKTCAKCHVLFNEGGKIGPELTGSQRTNPDYILTKVLDPNAVVARDYQVTVIETINGRIITGIIKNENDKIVTVQTLNEIITIPPGDIQERRKSTLSMMPEGQLAQLTDSEILNLIAYLAGPGQVALPKDP
jgi:putative heme-binding domain-containing protein